MSDATDRDTIDWDAFWREASESARNTARPGRFDKPDQFRRFFDSRGAIPASSFAVTTPPRPSSPKTASERAIRDLYDLVAPGGHLVFDYPNRHT